jgi:DNA-binding NarL/FixJ family response regulator
MLFQRIRVVMIDPQQLFRDGLRLWFLGQDTLTLVGEAPDAHGGYRVIDEQRPDVVLVERVLPDVDGFTATRVILERHTAARVVILTTSDSAEHVAKAFREGASGYVLKRQSGQELAHALRTVGTGEKYLPPGLGNLDHTTGDASEDNILGSLTRREREIFEHIIRGLPNRLIAARLRISIKTVETHREHINRKVGAHCTADLVRLAARHGLFGHEPIGTYEPTDEGAL